jgi:hypothetical protein
MLGRLPKKRYVWRKPPAMRLNISYAHYQRSLPDQSVPSRRAVAVRLKPNPRSSNLLRGAGAR